MTDSNAKGTSRSGVYELQLKKKLLQQKLELCSSKCDKLSAVVAQKHKRREEQQRILSLANAQPSAHDKHRKQTSPQQGALARPTLFKAGGGVDLVHKKQLLERKRAEIEKAKAAAAAQAAARKQPRASAVEAVHFPPPRFTALYAMGDCPCSVEHGSGEGLKLVWVCPLQQLDYEHYLLVFLEGVRCQEDPCKFIARQGFMDLLEAAVGCPERVLPSLRGLALGIRAALQTRKPDLVVYICNVSSKCSQLCQ
jgi:Parkin co-regulated protein